MDSIGNNAFDGCSGLTSITIPNSVTSIGEGAFFDCSGLISVAIPSSMTSIGEGAFYSCTGLTEPIIVNNMFVFFPSSFQGSYTIPSNITKILDYAFADCNGLTSIIIPNSVTEIGAYAFGECSGLTSVSIPNSVTKIGHEAFSGCRGLTSVTIPNSITKIEHSAFLRCSGLTYANIPNSVDSIGDRAFFRCDGLTSVTIPNSVVSIGIDAFSYCDNIQSLYINSTVNPGISCEELYIGDSITIVQNNNNYNTIKLRKVVLGKNVSQIRTKAFSNAPIEEFTITGEEPPYCYPYIFGTQDLSCATLYVPEDKASYYQTNEPWSKFGTLKTLNGETPAQPTACDKPTISYADGQLVFTSTTDRAKYHCTITSPDMKSDVLSETGKVSLDACYNITVYATADGYTQSENATATLYWIKADGSLDNINTAKMRGIVVTSDGGIVTVSGLNEGEQVQFFDTDGKLLGSQKAVSGKTSLSTSEPVIICKVGDTSLKTMVK